MKNRLYLLLMFACSLCISCTRTKINGIAEVIHYKGDSPIVADSLLLEDCSVLKLEDNSSSIFVGIDRVLSHADKYYLLDTRMKQVLIYDTLGHYINSIRKIGNGVGEYVSLKDMAIDRANNHLLLLAQPSMILYYTLDGDYIKQTRLKGYHNSIGVDEKFIYLSQASYVNNKPTNGSVVIIDKSTGKTTEKMTPLFETAPYCYNRGMTVSATNNLYFTRKFDDNIYQLGGTEPAILYTIDWNELSFPSDKKEQTYDCSELHFLCSKNKYVYSITDIQDTDSTMCFRTNLPGLFVLSKSRKEVKWFPLIESEDLGVPLPSYLPVGGTDGEILFVFPAHYLMTLKKTMETNPKASKMEKYLESMDEESNPLLLRYTLK